MQEKAAAATVKIARGARPEYAQDPGSSRAGHSPRDSNFFNVQTCIVNYPRNFTPAPPIFSLSAQSDICRQMNSLRLILDAEIAMSSNDK